MAETQTHHATSPGANRGVTIQVVLPRDVHEALLREVGTATISQWVRAAIVRRLGKRIGVAK